MNIKTKKRINKLLEEYDFDYVEYGFYLRSHNSNFEIRKDENLFMYPASIYKIFIAAEVLRQIDSGKLGKSDTFILDKKNIVDKKVSNFSDDKRPLLKYGDNVSLGYLLDLMLYRSDNTAANSLIDIVSRESINKNIIDAYGLSGSEVTRKYLPRDAEDREYKDAPITMSCARHITEFFEFVENGELINKNVSLTLKKMLQKNKSSWISGILQDSWCFIKGGWFESQNYYNQKVEWLGSSGIIINKDMKYSFCLLTLIKDKRKNVSFPVNKFSSIIHNYIKTNL